MQVKIDCQVTLPQILVEELMAKFKLSPQDGKLVLSGKQFQVVETVLTEYIVSGRASAEVNRLEKLLSSRVNEVAGLAAILYRDKPYDQARSYDGARLAPSFPVDSTNNTTSTGNKNNIPQEEEKKLPIAISNSVETIAKVDKSTLAKLSKIRIG